MDSHVQRMRSGEADLSTHGWTRPLFAQSAVDQIVDILSTTEPKAHGLPGHGWSLKKLRQWVSEKLKCIVSRSTLHATLKAAGLSWKKCKKLLGKRNPQKREAYLAGFLKLYERVAHNETVLVYVDESHFHRDLENGYTWGPVGERIWRVSDCPPLSERVNWYGAYNFTDGDCLIWAEGSCNKENTMQFLRQMKEWIHAQGRSIVVVWDGAPWHRAQVVVEEAQGLGIEIIALPGYSPDLNPIEGLWKWMREEVCQLHCYPSTRALFDACKTFVQTINQNPLAIVDRLWPRFKLDPEPEKLGVSI